jgi:tetratricopeptide (TPR) repeat protein
VAEADEEIREAARLGPKQPNQLFSIGLLCARVGRWGEAIALFERSRKAYPERVEPWLSGPTLYLYTGDIDGYRRLCRETYQRFGQTGNVYYAMKSAWAYSLVPDGILPAEHLLKLATPGTAEQPGPGRLLASGLAHYRARRYADALAALQRIRPKAEARGLDVSTFAVQALVHARSGQADEAREVLARAKALLATGLPDPAKGRAFGEDWQDWLDGQILCREAETLLKPTEKQAGNEPTPLPPERPSR